MHHCLVSSRKKTPQIKTIRRSEGAVRHRGLNCCVIFNLQIWPNHHREVVKLPSLREQLATERKCNLLSPCGTKQPEAAPKTHKWDIDHCEGAEGAELYLTIKCLTSPSSPPAFLSAASTRSAFNSAVTFNSVCSRDSTSNRPLGAALTAPRGVAVKGGI